MFAKFRKKSSKTLKMKATKLVFSLHALLRLYPARVGSVPRERQAQKENAREQKVVTH